MEKLLYNLFSRKMVKGKKNMEEISIEIFQQMERKANRIKQNVKNFV